MLSRRRQRYRARAEKRLNQSGEFLFGNKGQNQGRKLCLTSLVWYRVRVSPERIFSEKTITRKHKNQELRFSCASAPKNGTSVTIPRGKRARFPWLLLAHKQTIIAEKLSIRLNSRDLPVKAIQY
jgi:hypothetical protein